MPALARPVRHPAQQDRAHRTGEAIVEAALTLLSTRDFDAVSVADIAREAGVSVGGVYARFPDKAAIGLAVDELLLARARVVIARAMDAKRLAGQPLRSVIESYVRAMIRFFDQHRRLMRTLATRARGDERYAARDAVREFNEFAHVLLCDRLLERRPEIARTDPRSAAEFGIMMVSAAARETVLFGHRRMNLSTNSGQQCARELTRAFCSYLGAAHS